MYKYQDILEELSHCGPQLKRQFSVRRIGLFGSVLRGESREGSDIDILVELDEPTFDHYMDLKFYLQQLFGAEVDLVTVESIKPRMRAAIEQEVIYAEGL
jgi:predicted nucleotidyltransferase